MNDPTRVESFPGDSSSDSFRGMLLDAARYWEGHRVGYNIVLSSISLAWLIFTWPHFRPAFTGRSGLMLLGLVAIANACYCAAYPVDLALQCSSLRTGWKRRRWVLWSAGTLFAAILTYYWIADEIYPSVG